MSQTLMTEAAISIVAHTVVITLGLMASSIAHDKNRGVGRWYVAGVLFNVLAVLVVVVLPARHQTWNV